MSEEREGASVPDEQESKPEIVVVDRRASTEMERRGPTGVSEPIGDPNSTGALVRLAMERDMSVDVLERLLKLKREEEAEAARRAFVAAFAAFHAEAPTIAKDKTVTYPTRDGEAVGYTHASIGNVVETAGPLLGRHGFGWGWTPARSSDKGNVSVTCRLTHELGHFEEATLSAGPDSSGKKNPIQQVASTVTYLQRYTFLLVTGLATRDQNDDDGKGSGGKPAGSELPHKAAETIEAFGKYLGEANARGDLERWLEVPATEWGPDQYGELRELWPRVRAGDADTMAAIEKGRTEGDE
jgi:hypothetical protein